MLTVHPSIMIGAYGWDQSRVPRDEFEIRVRELHRTMDTQGLKAMLVYGDAREHSALAYISNFVPRLRWGMALIPRDGEPRLLISMSSRDVPAMKLATWIADVVSGWTWESAFDPWLARLAGDGPTDIGAVGFDLMRPPLFASLEKSLGNRFRLHLADEALSSNRLLRPRELSQVREACALAQAAGGAFINAWRTGKGVEAAALDAERAARLMAAQDVRTLTGFDGGRTLSPFRGALDEKASPLLGYIAVKRMGYWAEIFVSAAESASDVHAGAQAGLEAILQSARAGAMASDLYAEAVARLGPHPLHPVLSGSVGRRIGLSPDEGSAIRRDSRHALAAGEVYALHVGAHDSKAGGAVASAMIAITPQGCETLCRSPEPTES